MTKALLILVIVTACLGLFLFTFSSHVFPFTTDSLIYISAAQHWGAGEGLVFDNVFVQPPGPETLPLKLYPPGYSFLIALLSWLGMDPPMAALSITRFFYLLLPLGFFLVLSQVMPLTLAVVISAVCAFMFSYSECGLMAWTDIPFLSLSLISFFFAFKAVGPKSEKQFLYAFLSGLVSGAAVLTRNVGYALVLSIILGFLHFPVFRLINFKRILRIGRAYLMGVLLLLAPYWLRNFLVFGELNPYRLPPAKVALTENLLDYGHTLARMILINPSYFYILLVLVAGMLIWFLWALRPSFRSDKRRLLCAGTVILYFFIGSALVILSKTFYFMPEPINERYLIQYAWILMAGLVFSIHMGLQKLQEFAVFDKKGVALFLLLVFLLVQIFPAADFFFRQERNLKIAKTVEAHSPVLDKVPSDHVIVSNVMDMTAYFSHRKVKLLNGYMPSGLIHFLGDKQKFAVLIVKDRNEDFRSYLYPLAWLNPDGYTTLYQDDEIVLWMPQERAF